MLQTYKCMNGTAVPPYVPHTLMFSTDAFGRLALNPVFWVPRLLSALICFLSPARLWFPSLILLDWKNRANMV